MSEREPEIERTWMEEIEVVGSQLIDLIYGLIEDSQVSRVIIRSPHNKKLLDVPLATGVLIGTPIAILAPLFVGVGFMAAMMARFKIQIIRTKS